jgi:filamentous hemagglutinin family protein
VEKQQRHNIILNEVHIHNRVLLTDLAGILKVSNEEALVLLNKYGLVKEALLQKHI